MRNKYPGICYRCNQIVAKGEGHFEKVNGIKPLSKGWRVQHAECAIKYRKNNPDKIFDDNWIHDQDMEAQG